MTTLSGEGDALVAVVAKMTSAMLWHAIQCLAGNYDDTPLFQRRIQATRILTAIEQIIEDIDSGLVVPRTPATLRAHHPTDRLIRLLSTDGFLLTDAAHEAARHFAGTTTNHAKLVFMLRCRYSVLKNALNEILALNWSTF